MNSIEMPLTDVEQATYRAGAVRIERLRTAATRGEGVVHTPPELARAVIRLADDALKASCGYPDGLATRSITIVDPAVGTGAFPAALTALHPSRGQLLTYDIDPIAKSEFPSLLSTHLQRGRWTHHCGNALSLRRLPNVDPRAPLAIIGNPPWKGRSASRGDTHSEEALNIYRRDHNNQTLNEARIGVLSDDYVRFFAWAQGMLARHQSGGVIAFVTNDSFLRGPVYRGMRYRLWSDPSALSVLSLGGNSLVARASRDENVFGVRPGVAISVLSYHPTRKSDPRPRYGRLKGTRQEKLTRCLSKVPLAPLANAPSAPHFLLSPSSAPTDYWSRWVSIDSLFPYSGEGIQTNRDSALITAGRDELERRIDSFLLGQRCEGDEALYRNRRHFDPDKARQTMLSKGGLTADDIEVIAFRPFEERYAYLRPPLCHRPRPELRRAISRSEFCLLTVRKDVGDKDWNHIAATRTVPDACYFSSRSGCRTRAFPTHTPAGAPNICAESLRRLRGGVASAETHTDAFAYSIAILASPAYRQICRDTLRVDYPRLPVCAEQKAWDAIVRRGRELLAIMLRQSKPGRATPVQVGHRSVHTYPEGLGKPCEVTEGFVVALMKTG